MMRTDRFDESTVEQAAKEWLAEIGFHTGYAPMDAAVDDVRDSRLFRVECGWRHLGLLR